MYIVKYEQKKITLALAVYALGVYKFEIYHTALLRDFSRLDPLTLNSNPAVLFHHSSLLLLSFTVDSDVN